MEVNAAVAKILKMEGVEIVTGFPNVILHEYAAKEGIRQINFRNERVAIEANIGYARTSFGKRIGVCALQGGAGLEVGYPGLRQAYADSVPVLLLPNGEPRNRIHTNPYFNPVVELRGVVKMVDSIIHPELTCEIMRRAFTALRMGRPRPVVVEIPEEGWGKKVEFDDALFNYKPVKATKSGGGDPADIKEVVKTLIAAKNPMLLAGQGVLYAMGWDELRELAELLELPVMTTLNAKSVFPENHPLSLGAGGRAWNQALQNFLQKSDVILMIGSSYTRHYFTTPLPPGKTVLQVTIDEHDINKDYTVAQAVIGDAKLVMRQIIDDVKRVTGGKGRKGNGAIAGQIKADKEEWFKKWMPKFTSNEIPINPYRVFWDAMHTVDRTKTIVGHDAGSCRDQLSAMWETLIPGGFLGYGKDHMLGSGLGFIIGAKLANPDKFCITFLGDGAFGEVGMDIETTARAKIPVTIVVNNNGELGGSKKICPEACKTYSIEKMTGDYRKVAEALGLHSERIEKPEEIIPAIKRAQKANDAGIPAFIEYIGKVEMELSKYP